MSVPVSPCLPPSWHVPFPRVCPHPHVSCVPVSVSDPTCPMSPCLSLRPHPHSCISHVPTSVPMSYVTMSIPMSPVSPHCPHPCTSHVHPHPPSPVFYFLPFLSNVGDLVPHTAQQPGGRRGWGESGCRDTEHGLWQRGLPKMPHSCLISPMGATIHQSTALGTVARGRLLSLCPLSLYRGGSLSHCPHVPCS